MRLVIADAIPHFPLPVISSEAGRRFFFPLRSCEADGLRREKSLLIFGLNS
jgi:hypothetical protein